MVDRIIQDIKGALENNLYFAALNCALTLPDICGKAEYPTERSSKKRYIDWYDKEIGCHERDPEQNMSEEMPCLLLIIRLVRLLVMVFSCDTDLNHALTQN